MIQIKDKSACCGCAACVQICPKQCISLKEDKEGFLYPTVNRNLCIECGKCETVCPKLHSFEAHEPLKVLQLNILMNRRVQQVLPEVSLLCWLMLL